MTDNIDSGEQETTESQDGEAVIDTPETDTGETEQVEGDKQTDGADAEESKEADADDKPDVPETYELKDSEGNPLEGEALENASNVARELGLTNEAAQKLVDSQSVFIESYNEQLKTQHDERVEQWVDEIKSDKEYGGANFEQSQKHVKTVLDKFGTPELKQALDDTGYGNHPDLYRFVARIGKAMAEDTPNDGSNTGQRKTPAEIMYGKKEE